VAEPERLTLYLALSHVDGHRRPVPAKDRRRQLHRFEHSRRHVPGNETLDFVATRMDDPPDDTNSRNLIPIQSTSRDKSAKRPFLGWRNRPSGASPCGAVRKSTVNDARTLDIFRSFFCRARLFRRHMILGGPISALFVPRIIFPHYKFGLGGHRDFLFYSRRGSRNTHNKFPIEMFPRQFLPRADDNATIIPIEPTFGRNDKAKVVGPRSP